MTTRMIFWAGLLLWLATAAVVAAPSAAAPAGAGRGFMWEARKGNQLVYLLGTIHVGRPEFYPLSAEKTRRLQAAASIVVEADVSQAARVAPIAQRLAFYPPGEPGLDVRLSAALKPRVEAQMTRAGLPPEAGWRMKPWMLANTLVLLNVAQMGFNPAHATEAYLFSFATANAKPIGELESLEFQLRLFDSAPAATQMAYLEQAVKGIDSAQAESEVRGIVAAWESGDAAAAERLLARMTQTDGLAERYIKEQVFEGRHPAMVAGIEKLAASGKPHVVAVGSFHFFGPKGLLELLKQRGYTITPVQ
jgi:uncharacterized protein YbaP (TraB family)